ncbi:hypothetical protein INS49_015022 [Diaporthe citri]|uniref:uncharacterized protein n=1 Tax=Diaporthe citri TaxID=83186 RepID=UPI001C7E8522|nr:uncharacterized protein INS49_015022 [Diaporthe citri]KAG6357145.1 hypothetical protein INS49_015022 [Diaporthe citri]
MASPSPLIKFDTVNPAHFREPLRLLTTDPAWAELEEGALARTNMSVGRFVIGHEVVHFENNRPVAGAGAGAPADAADA